MRRSVAAVAVLLATALALPSCQDAAPPVAPDAATPAADAAASAGATATSAIVEFGRDIGSPFHPATGHDRSLHAKDKLYPRTTVIAAGGTVTFRRGPVHAVAIYAPGTEPEDIDVTQLVPAPVPGLPPLITDAGGLLAAEPITAGTIFTPQEWSYTFTTPGRYLVICRVLPHFTEASMYGWVIVK